MADQPTTRIRMSDDTKRFYQGVASADEVTTAHADVDFPDFQTRERMFWFYLGVMAAGEHGCRTEDELTNFIRGAVLRAPVEPTADDTEETE
jgi:hypothetical protein